MNPPQSRASKPQAKAQEPSRKADNPSTSARRKDALPTRNGTAEQRDGAGREISRATPCWTQFADGEARNALQVVLSGSELLLDNFFGRLSPAQDQVLQRVLASARRLNGIIMTLSNPEEIIVDEPRANLNLGRTRAMMTKA